MRGEWVFNVLIGILAVMTFGVLIAAWVGLILEGRERRRKEESD